MTLSIPLVANNRQQTPSTNSLEDDTTPAPRAFKEEGTPEGLLSSATSLSKLTIDTEEDDVEEEERDNDVSATFGHQSISHLKKK